MKNKTAVLYCEPGSIYHQLNCDVWDEKRNALTFNRPEPIIAHPPCRLWSRLHHFSKAPKCEKLMAITAMMHIRKYGGVLEHPAGSHLFRTMSCNMNGKIDKYGGFLRSINQKWYGYKAEKRTYLYICGIGPGELPPFDLDFTGTNYVIDTKKKNLGRKYVNKNERSTTPIKLAEYLISVIKIINEK